MKRAVTTLALAAAVAFAASAASAQTLNAIKSRGMLNCGANGTLGGFGLPDAQVACFIDSEGYSLAVRIEGARWCVKSSTGHRFAQKRSDRIGSGRPGD